MRTVKLRDGYRRRYLTATLNKEGGLVIEGQDFGPETASVSSSGEYEWCRTIDAEHIPRLLALLDAPVDAKILTVLANHWTLEKADELETRIRDSDIPSSLWTHGG